MIKHPEGFWKSYDSAFEPSGQCLQKQKNYQKSIGMGGEILRITKSANSRMTASPLMANPIMPNVFFSVFRKTAAMPSPTPTRFRNRTIRLRVGNRLRDENQGIPKYAKRNRIYTMPIMNEAIPSLDCLPLPPGSGCFAWKAYPQSQVKADPLFHFPQWGHFLSAKAIVILSQNSVNFPIRKLFCS